MPQGVMYPQPCQAAASVPEQRDHLLARIAARAPRPGGCGLVIQVIPLALLIINTNNSPPAAIYSGCFLLEQTNRSEGLAWEISSCNDFQKPVTAHAVPRPDDSVDSSCH